MPTVAAPRHRLALTLGLLLFTTPFVGAGNPRNAEALTTNPLNPGDIIRTDSGDFMQGGFLIKLDPQTGQETILSQGGHLGFSGRPMGVVCDRNGQLIIANQSSLLRVNPQTGVQTVIRDTSGAPGAFWSLALDRNDNILVAAETAILRVDPASGATRVLSAGGFLNLTLGVAVSGNKSGEIFATSARYDAGIGWVGTIVRVNPRDGRQTVVSDAGHLGYLLGITVQGDDIFVTGLQGHDQNFGIGQVVHVNARTGAQTVISVGGGLVRPAGISLDANNQLIVADPYTINPESADLFDGALISINPATGEQTLLVRGQGSCVNPFAVAVVTSSNRGR